MRFHENMHQQFVDGLFPERDFLVAVRRAGAQLQAVERALAGQPFLQMGLGGQQFQQRILPQLLVVVEILVAQRQPIHPLRHHLRHTMFHPRRITPIQKTARQTRQKIQPLVRFP